MQSAISRFMQLDDWIFEVKMVRALRVKKYGEAYSGIASLTANGDTVYIDSQMTREGQDFTRRDFLTFYKFCQTLEMKSVVYDKIKNGERFSRTVDIIENQTPDSHIVRLVR